MSFSTFIQGIVKSEGFKTFKENHNFGQPKQMQRVENIPTTAPVESTFNIKEYIPILAVGGIILIYMLKKKK